MWVRPAAHITHSSLLLTGGSSSSSSRAELLHNAAATEADTGKHRRRILPADLLVSTFPPSLTHHITSLQRPQEVSVGIGFYFDLDRT